MDEIDERLADLAENQIRDHRSQHRLCNTINDKKKQKKFFFANLHQNLSGTLSLFIKKTIKMTMH